MSTDAISDLLTRIRNACRVKHENLEVYPFSKVRENILNILKDEGFISDYEVINKGNIKGLKIILKYDENKESVITMLRRVSTPGKRVYVEKSEIPKVLNGFGISILSTNKGIMTGHGARKKNLGGEILCYVG